MLINKFKYVANGSKKVLHKVKKQWVTISVVALGLLGGVGAYTEMTPVHINAETTNTVATNNKQTITQQADQVHSNLVNNAEKTQQPTMKLGADSNTNSYDNPQSDYDYSDGNMNGNYTYYSDNNPSDNEYTYSDNGASDYDVDNGTVINNNNNDDGSNVNINNNNNVVGGNGGAMINNNNNVSGGNANINNNNNVVGGNGGTVINNNNNDAGGNANVNNNNNVVAEGGSGGSVSVTGGTVVAHGGNGGSVIIGNNNNQPSKQSDNSDKPSDQNIYYPSDSDASDIITMYGTTYVSENDIYQSDLDQLSDNSAPLQNKLTENGVDYIPMDYVIPDDNGMYHVNSTYFRGANSDTTPSDIPSDYTTPTYTITPNSDGTVTINGAEYVPSDKLTSDGKYVLESYGSDSGVITQSDVEYVPVSDTTPESNGLYNVNPNMYDNLNTYDPNIPSYETYDTPTSYDQDGLPTGSYETYEQTYDQSSDTPNTYDQSSYEGASDLINNSDGNGNTSMSDMNSGAENISSSTSTYDMGNTYDQNSADVAPSDNVSYDNSLDNGNTMNAQDNQSSTDNNVTLNNNDYDYNN